MPRMRKQPADLRAQLIADEGIRLRPYKCTAGYFTIGVGRNLDTKGISREGALFMLDRDIKECFDSLRKRYAWFMPLRAAGVEGNVRAEAVVNMRFQLGAAGFHKFKNTRKALAAGDWKEAARQMLDSAWAKQTPRRARRLAKQIITGIRQ